MSAEVEAAIAEVAEALAPSGVDWELACKRSVGASFARRRDEPVQTERWIEEALAVRVRCSDGRSALSSSAGWAGASAAALGALADARRQPLPCRAGAGYPGPWADAESAGREEGEPPEPESLGRLLELVLAAASSVDERTGRLELGRARAARVTTRLVNSRGLDLSIAQDLSHLEAEVVGREIGRHAGCFDSVAAPRIADAEARALGDRLGRALRRQFDGVPRAPAAGGLLLGAEAIGEISFRLAPALLGLEATARAGAGPVVGAGLRLREDAAEDREARSRPADGVGRALQVVDLVREGRLQLPERERLPLVRPGIADPPQPGWLRLSWGSENGLSDDELIARLGSGLLIERAVTESIDADALTWRGLVEGWWVEGGAAKRPVARLPLTLDLRRILPAVRAAGAEPRPAHGSGTIRAVPWLLDELPGRTDV